MSHILRDDEDETPNYPPLLTSEELSLNVGVNAEETESPEVVEKLNSIQEIIKVNTQYRSNIQQELSKVEAQLENVVKLKKKVDKSSKVLQNFKRPQNARPFANVYQKRKASSYFFQDGSKRPEENPDEKQLKGVVSIFLNVKRTKKWTDRELRVLPRAICKVAREKKTLSVVQKYENDNREDSQNELLGELELVKQIPDAELLLSHTEFTLDDWSKVSDEFKNRGGFECKQYYEMVVKRGLHKKKWTKAEDLKLLKLSKKYKCRSWEKIAEEMGGNLTGYHCFQRYQRSLNTTLLKSKWTKDEDERLLKAVLKYGSGNWQQIANSLGGRTGQQCLHRWRKTVNPEIRKGRWLLEEDKRLYIATKSHESKNWKDINTHVKGRTDVQCRERWFNVLNPKNKVGEWSSLEKEKFDEGLRLYGAGNWSKISSTVKTRTDNQCWRRWKRLFPEEYMKYQIGIAKRKSMIKKNFVGREKERSEMNENEFFDELSQEEKDKILKSAKVRKRTRQNSMKTHRYVLPEKVPDISPYMVYQLQRHYQLVGLYQRFFLFVGMKKTEFVNESLLRLKTDSFSPTTERETLYSQIFSSPLCVYRDMDSLPSLKADLTSYKAMQGLYKFMKSFEYDETMEPAIKKRKISKLDFFRKSIQKKMSFNYLQMNEMKKPKFKKLVMIFNALFARSMVAHMRKLLGEKPELVKIGEYVQSLPHHSTKPDIFKPKKSEEITLRAKKEPQE